MRDELLNLRGREHPAHVVDDVNVAHRGLLELQQLGGLEQVLQLQRAFRHVVRFAPLFETCDVILDLHGAFPRAKVAPHQEVVERRDANHLEQVRNHLLRHTRLDIVALETLPYLVENAQDVVHRVRRRIRARQQAIQQTASRIVGHKARQRLRLYERRHHHLVQPLLDFLHPRVVDIVLERVEVMLDDRHEALIVAPLKLARRAIDTRAHTLEHIALGNAHKR